MMLLFRMLLVLLLAFSLEACEPVTKWSITGGEFHLKHKICKEIPGNGALKIAVPTGFDLSNSNITKQEPKGWTLTENGTTIKLVTSNTIPANTSIEITMSEANAPAHYMAPFYEEFTEFGAVVSKKGLDCAKCTGTGGNIPSSPVNCEMSDWGNWSDCSVSCGAGNKTKTRTVTTQPENGGTACLALKDTETCNEGDCPKARPNEGAMQWCWNGCNGADGPRAFKCACPAHCIKKGDSQPIESCTCTDSHSESSDPCAPPR